MLREEDKRRGAVFVLVSREHPRSVRCVGTASETRRSECHGLGSATKMYSSHLTLRTDHNQAAQLKTQSPRAAHVNAHVCLFLYSQNLNHLNVTKPRELIKNNLLRIY